MRSCLTVCRIMSLTILCAIADDECLDDVVATGRVLAATGGLRPVFVHVGQVARLAPSPIGFGVGAGAAATASLQCTPAQQARDVGAALVEAADLWDDPTIIATGDPATELDRLGQEHDAALVVAGTRGRGLISGAQEALEALAARLPVADVECAAPEPAPIGARLDQLACSRRADFIVVGSRGSGVLRTVVQGSLSQDLLRTAGRPLVVVPPGSDDIRHAA